MKRYIQILNTVWLAMLIFDIALTLISFFLFYFKVINPIINNKINLYCNIFAMVIIILLILYADKVTKKRIKKIRNENLINKLVKYKTIYIKQICCYNLISIVSLIFMIISMQIGYIIFSIFSIFLITLAKERESKVKFDLALTQEELSKFNHIKFNK